LHFCFERNGKLVCSLVLDNAFAFALTGANARDLGLGSNLALEIYIFTF
jgi:hypothetical protein